MKKTTKAKATKAKKPGKSKQSATAKSSAYYAQSKRLGFRLITPADEALYCELFTDAKALVHVCPPLTRERAAESFKKALAVTAVKPLKQRISVIVERATKKPIGLASIKLIDSDKRLAEGGLLFKPTAHAQRFATESSLALIGAAFRRHTIDELCAFIPHEHKAAHKLVVGSGYMRGQDLTPTVDRPARSSWHMKRDFWADTFK